MGMNMDNDRESGAIQYMKDSFDYGSGHAEKVPHEYW